MYSYLSQICGIALLILLMILSNKIRIIKIESIRAYYFALYTAFISSILDICSIVCIKNFDIINPVFTIILCKLYLVSIIWVAYSSLNYLMVEIYVENSKYKMIELIAGISLAFTSLLTFILPISVYNENDEVYTYGASVLFTYVSAVFFMLFSVDMIFVFKEKINNKRRRSVLFWLLIWIVSGFIQFMYNELLLVSFSSALCLTLVFFEIENPIVCIDRKTGLYNRYILRKYIKEKINNNERVYGLSFNLKMNVKDLSEESIKEIIIIVSDYLSLLPQTIAFRNDTYNFMVSFKTLTGLQQGYARIRKFLTSSIIGGYEGVSISYMLMLNSDILCSLDDAYRLYRYALIHMNDKDLIYVNQSLLDELNNYENTKMEIVDALKEDRFEVFYQPIYDTRTKTFTSSEALVRLRSRNNNYISPEEFIPIAEDSGLIIQIGERVFDKVCEFINKHKIDNLGIKYIEVNLSALQCEQQDLYNRFKNIMTARNVQPHQINLEITETVHLNSSGVTTRNISDFQGSGISFSLDDFGTGSSNLEYITQMSVNIIKFDHTLTQSYFVNDRTKIIFNHIVPMVKELSMEIVCEGVETELQYNAMLEFGIEHIQGYYFSKPLCENDYIAFVIDNNKLVKERK